MYNTLCKMIKKEQGKTLLRKMRSHKIICVEQKKGDNKTDVNIEI